MLKKIEAGASPYLKPSIDICTLVGGQSRPSPYIVPLRSNRFPVKRLEHLQEIVVDDVALKFFLHFIP
jgi:hypothetical protein